MSGQLDGTIDVAGERISFDEGVGYHDHNWGFWRGVSWQWGQVRVDNLPDPVDITRLMWTTPR